MWWPVVMIAGDDADECSGDDEGDCVQSVVACVAAASGVPGGASGRIPLGREATAPLGLKDLGGAC